MIRHPTRVLSFIVTCLVMSACAETEPQPERDVATVCDESAARTIAEGLGRRMREVSLLAPDSIVDRELREAYDELVTPELLQTWQADPGSAPGRRVSNPWPARLEVRSITPESDGCHVEGDVVHVTSSDTVTAIAREPVSLLLVDQGGWRISRYVAGASGTPDPARDSAVDPDAAPADDTAAPPADSTGAAAAVDVLRRYYALIDDGELGSAYALWSGEGSASGQSYDEFTRGYEDTDRVRAVIGEPGRIEGAAGSRYIEIPVRLEASTRDGAVQRFEGTYTLRRSVVDGATPLQRRWRISSADMRAVGE